MKTIVLKVKPLDLHGIKHQEVIRIVESYTIRNRNKLPLQIITGNSDRMKELVIKSLKSNNFSYHIGNKFNKGFIIVNK